MCSNILHFLLYKATGLVYTSFSQQQCAMEGINFRGLQTRCSNEKRLGLMTVSHVDCFSIRHEPELFLAKVVVY